MLRIVVVEDDCSMSQAIERILRAGGYEPIMFASPAASLAAFAAIGADCLVLDIDLPGMSGFELFEKLIPQGGAPPTIFITARDEPSFREKAASLGAKSFHSKPFFGQVLLSAIQQALQT